MPQPESLTSARLLVVIVHYRTPGLLLDCIASLLPQIDPAADRIIVVDNASADGSIETLRHIAGITLVESATNLGFAGANNLAIRQCEAERYLLLNPDTVLRPGALPALMQFLDENPDAAMVGPRLEYPDGQAQLSAFGYPNPVGELLRGAAIGVLDRLLNRWNVLGPISDVPQRADWVAGACLLIRREVLQKVGLLDDKYFMYFEEVDFCRRAAKAGFNCWYLPSAHVVHLVGRASGIVAGTMQKRLPAYWFASRHRYFRTHYGYAGTVLADAFWLSGFTAMRVRKLLTGTSAAYCAQGECRDFLRNESRQLFLRMQLLEKHGMEPATAQHLPPLGALPAAEQRPGVAADIRPRQPGLLALIREDYRAHRRDWTTPGFRAMAVYRFGAWQRAIRLRMLRGLVGVFYRPLFRYVRNHYGIELPNTARIGRRVVIEHQHGIVIHGSAEIGDDSVVRQGVTVGNRFLHAPFDAPRLGRRVNVGAGAKLLGAITIGDDANIGANAVVLIDVPAGATAVGIPAKIVGRTTTPVQQ